MRIIRECFGRRYVILAALEIGSVIAFALVLLVVLWIW